MSRRAVWLLLGVGLLAHCSSDGSDHPSDGGSAGDSAAGLGPGGNGDVGGRPGHGGAAGSHPSGDSSGNATTAGSPGESASGQSGAGGEPTAEAGGGAGGDSMGRAGGGAAGDSMDHADAGAAGEPTGSAGTGTSLTAHRVFVTSAAYDGDLVSAANALVGSGKISASRPFAPTEGWEAASGICAYHAKLGGLSGTFIALIQLPDGTDGLSKLAATDGPWSRPDGLPVASNAVALSSGWLRVPIGATETGALRSFDPAATDSNVWGTISGAPVPCNGWTSSASMVDAQLNQALAGSYTNSGGGWRSTGFASCATPRPIYCAQLGAGSPLELPKLPAGAKRVFVSTEPNSGDFTHGVITMDPVHTAADNICTLDASFNGLDGTFRAWVASTEQGAADYFASNAMDGPWYRTDGFLVAQDRTELVFPKYPRLPIGVDAKGAFAGGLVWVGAATNGAATDNCDDFTIGEYSPMVNQFAGSAGLASAAGYSWMTFERLNCGSSSEFYCFEQ